MEEKKFKKKKEDFVCDNCGLFVKGDGFTDHCPKCLWSKHVDINPGDRMSKCGGMMEPRGVKKEGEQCIIYYQCVTCHYKHRVKQSKEDSFNQIIKISENIFKNGEERRTKKENRRKT
jgi:hypothetical protein